jgi:hypothetical protein
MSETTLTAPAFPVIEIDGRRLVLKFDFLAKFRLSELGVGAIDMRSFRAVDRPEDADPRVLAIVLKLFSAFVASNFIDRENPGSPANVPTPEYWATVIGDDTALWGKMCKATGEALGKVLLSAAAPAPAKDATGAVKTN